MGAGRRSTSRVRVVGTMRMGSLLGGSRCGGGTSHRVGGVLGCSPSVVAVAQTRHERRTGRGGTCCRHFDVYWMSYV